MPHLTGDSLSISILMWSASITPLSLMVLDLRSRRWAWAIGFGVVGTVFVVLGFIWQILLNLLQNPPNLDENGIFLFGSIIVAAAYGVFLRPSDSSMLSRETRATVLDGAAITPLIVLVAAPFFPREVLSIVEQNTPILSVSAIVAVLAIIEDTIERRRGNSVI